MKKWKLLSAGLSAALGLTPALFAQGIPGVPQIPSKEAAQAGLPVAAAVPAPPPGGHTLLSFLGLSAEQKAACKLRLCQTPIGQLLNNTMKPLGAMTGGLLGGCCPTVNPADLLKPADSAEGAAARIQAKEAEAGKRRAAVRYLGTVDCRYYPEAEEGLIKALRTDESECVRYEAALALNRGCCCTKKVIAALTEAVKGGTGIGKVPEKSERVINAATAALNHCLCCAGEKPPEMRDKPPTPPDKPATPGDSKQPAELPRTVTQSGPAGGDVHLAAYYHQIEATPMKELKERAQKALVERKAQSEAYAPAYRRDRSLFSILVNARHGGHTWSEARVESQPPQLNQVVEKPVVPQIQSGHTSVVVSPKPMRSIHSASVGSAQPVVDSESARVRSSRKPVYGGKDKSMADGTTVVSAAHQSSSAPVQQLAGAADSASIVARWLPTLSRSPYPELREFAAKKLKSVDWHSHPDVVAGLVAAAKSDSHVAVRTTCINSLSSMGANSKTVMVALQELRSDSDSSVRDAAYNALVKVSRSR